MSRADISPAQALAYLARALTSADGTKPTLEGIVHHAAQLVPARWAVALVADRITNVPARLAASTDCEVTDTVALIAGEAGTGPGWWAFENAAVCHVRDLTLEERFGGYPRAMLERTPIRSVLAVPLVSGGDVLGVLTLYADRPGAFGEVEVQRALTVASIAGVTLGAAQAEDRADNLELALRNSRTIGAAIGILVERYRFTEDQAFDVLRNCSTRANRKLAELAGHLVDIGELPYEQEAVRWLYGQEADTA